jgi:phospholipid transport system substrate-binding protein
MIPQPGRAILPGIGLAAALCLDLGVANADDSQEAAAFLTAVSQEAIQKLTDAAASEGEKEQRFRELMETSFDLRRIGKFVLGINWRRASPEQRQNFIDVFEDVQVKRFLPMFAEYSDEKLLVTKVRQDQKRPELFFVNSTIRRPRGEPYFVEWRLHRHADRYKILDVSTEGVSMAVTLRNEYGSVAKQHGINGLIARLREKAGEDNADTVSAAKKHQGKDHAGRGQPAIGR